MLPPWLRRPFDRARLRDPGFAFLFESGPPGEMIAIDCETTGLDTRRDDIVTIAAIPIRNNRILTSQRFVATFRPSARMKPDAVKAHRLREIDVAEGRSIAEALPELLRFIGGRPLVGYYLAFDIAMINRPTRALLGIELPNPRLDVSGLYYDLKYGDAPPGTHIDLSFAAILSDLGLPALDAHNAFSDALMTAMMAVTLADLKARGRRIPRGAANKGGR